jgi:hypothetical protein
MSSPVKPQRGRRMALIQGIKLKCPEKWKGNSMTLIQMGKKDELG